MSQTHYLNGEPTFDVEILQAVEVPTIVQRAIDIPAEELPGVFDSTYAALMPAMAELGVRPIAPAIALYHQLPGDTFTVDIGFPVDKPMANPVTTESGVVLEPSALPAGEVARVSYFGSYDGLSQAWDDFMDELMSAGKTPMMPSFELYVTEPTEDFDPTTLRTDLFIRVTDAPPSQEN